MRIMIPGLMACVALPLLVADPALASVVRYSDMSVFNAAVSGASTFNFGGIVAPNSYASISPTVGGVTFTGTGSNNGNFVIGANVGLGFYGVPFFSGQSSNPIPNKPPGGGDPVEMTVTLAGATAIGFVYGSYDDSLIPVTVTLSTGDVFTIDMPLNRGVDTAFVGFTSGTPITSIKFAHTGYLIDITQFEVASAVSQIPGVPEPVTLTLFVAGLAGLGAMRRGRKST